MEGLFFSVHPVWWEKTLNSEILLILGLSILLILLLKKKWELFLSNIIQSWNSEEKSFVYTPVDPRDPLFIEKTLASLKKMIQHTYNPKKSEAHTFTEITAYIQNSDILSLGKMLEELLYSGKTLTHGEYEDINTRLLNFSQKGGMQNSPNNQ